MFVMAIHANDLKMLDAFKNTREQNHEQKLTNIINDLFLGIDDCAFAYATFAAPSVEQLHRDIASYCNEYRDAKTSDFVMFKIEEIPA